MAYMHDVNGPNSNTGYLPPGSRQYNPPSTSSGSTTGQGSNALNFDMPGSRGQQPMPGPGQMPQHEQAGQAAMMTALLNMAFVQMLQQLFPGQDNTAADMPASFPAGAMPGAPAGMKMEQDHATLPTGPTGRPEGDNRTADQIIEDNPILKNLGNQKDIKQGTLKEALGDWTANNKDEKSRADAAYDASRYLNYIDHLKTSKGEVRKDAGNGDLHGTTSKGEARSGTEAGVNVDCARAYERVLAKGGTKEEAKQAFYDALPKDGQLPKPNNKRDEKAVYSDGTNKSEFKRIMTEAGSALSFIPGVSSVLTGMGNTQGDFIDTLLGGFDAGLNTAIGGLKGFLGGKSFVGMYQGALEANKKPPEEVTK